MLVLLWAQSHFKLLMTGTPIPNGRACEAWTTFSRCDQEKFGSWKSFRDRYCIEKMTRWGAVYDESKNLDELKELSKKFMVRRSKREVLGQLPGLVRQNVYIALDRWAILKAEDGIDVDKIVDAVEKDEALISERVTVVRRDLGIAKAPMVLEHILETLEEVENCVVFMHHRDVYNILQNGLKAHGISFVTINGLTPPEERAKNVDIFQAGQARVFLASLRAANTGLTLTKAHTLIMAEYDWVPSVNEQAEGRVYRVSQTEICRVKYIVAQDSLDERVLNVVQKKSRNIAQAVDRE